ncbi:MAG: citrate lyase holo-[acyl-carrier protein] synthase [Tissierellaceae bacterium]|nr:citrate lyase holo-[acyl-carrier protein] synthase [Tissierellaceae bacterium]
MIDEKVILEILQSREDRRDKQLDLLKEYKSSLISFTLNTPGVIKDNEMYREIHEEGIDAITKILKKNNIMIIYKEVINKHTGSEGYMAVDLEALELKKMLVELEESHSLGRIFDIDVFDKEHNQISRIDIGLNSRRCLLCNKDARVCAKEKDHTYEDLYNGIVTLWKDYKNE